MPYRSGDVAKPGVSDDGKHLLFDHGNELRVLSLETRALEGVIQAPGSSVNFTTMALFARRRHHPDQLGLGWPAPAMADAGSAGRRRPGPRLELRQFVSNNNSTATCGAFDTDDKPAFVVTGSRDGYVYVWEMPKAEEVQQKPARRSCRWSSRRWRPAPARCASGPTCPR